MLDHVSLRVQDLPRALAPIGYAVGMEYPGGAGLGEPGKLDLWIALTDKPIHPTHLAFRTDRARVDAFHAAALAAGATDNGPPGVRTEYHAHYYAAFVLDPEGNNIEVVCQEPPGAARKPATARTAAARRPAKKIKKPARKPAKRAKRSAKPKAKKRR
jgi:catechol 2,3-dioxygenase-like lactoylglutathione lyase family enzyme